MGVHSNPSVNKHTRLCLRRTKSAAVAAKGRGGCLVQSRMIPGDPEGALVAFWLDIRKSKAFKVDFKLPKKVVHSLCQIFDTKVHG